MFPAMPVIIGFLVVLAVVLWLFVIGISLYQHAHNRVSKWTWLGANCFLELPDASLGVTLVKDGNCVRFAYDFTCKIHPNKTRHHKGVKSDRVCHDGIFRLFLPDRYRVEGRYKPERQPPNLKLTLIKEM